MLDPNCTDITDVAHPIRDLAAQIATETDFEGERYYAFEDYALDCILRFLERNGYIAEPTEDEENNNIVILREPYYGG